MNCTEKKVFNDRKSAKKAAEKVSLQKGKKITVYKCTACEFWHMTSYDKKKSRSISRHRKGTSERAVPQELIELRNHFKK